MNGNVVAIIVHPRKVVRQIYNLTANQEMSHPLLVAFQECEQVFRSLSAVKIFFSKK